MRAPIYAGFARVVGADLDEVEHPLREYSCFGEFFARGLRSGARRIEPDPQAVIAPCDGKVGEGGTIAGGRLYQAKGRHYSLAELVASGELAAELEGGSYVTLYLAPRDYHRVHMPVEASLTACYHVPGALFPVSEIFTSAVPRLFARNERVVARLDADGGVVVLVFVAAVGVGNVVLRSGDASSLDPLPRGGRRRWRDCSGVRLSRGEVVGAFHLGSTVIALFSPGAFELDPPPAGSPIRFGQKVGRACATGAKTAARGIAGVAEDDTERGT